MTIFINDKQVKCAFCDKEITEQFKMFRCPNCCDDKKCKRKLSKWFDRDHKNEQAWIQHQFDQYHIYEKDIKMSNNK